MKDPEVIFERLGLVIKLVRAAAEQAYSKLEIGSAQAKFLRHLGKVSAMSQADLARATNTAPTLTGRALETLVERGWVRRKRSEEDRREYLLELTAAGQRMRERVVQARAEVVRQVTEALDERDVADFERVAGKILAALEAA